MQEQQTAISDETRRAVAMPYPTREIITCKVPPETECTLMTTDWKCSVIRQRRRMKAIPAVAPRTRFIQTSDCVVAFVCSAEVGARIHWLSAGGYPYHHHHQRYIHVNNNDRGYLLDKKELGFDPL